MIWKIGDRAVICYRPKSELPSPHAWFTRDLARVGQTGKVCALPYETEDKAIRVPFQADNGDRFNPLTQILAPIIEDPYAAIPKGEHLELIS